MEQLSTDAARLWIAAAAKLLDENKALLTDLDSAIGDGDHGTNMARGFEAVRTKLATTPAADCGASFKLVGMTLLSTVGGASGPLYGGFFLALAKTVGGKAELTKDFLGQALLAGLEDIKRRGKASPGDKTMVDSLAPALQAFEQAPSDLTIASRAAADAAKAGAEGTTPLQARKGRASYLGERSIGHQDPGATSCWLLLEALAVTCSKG